MDLNAFRTTEPGFSLLRAQYKEWHRLTLSLRRLLPDRLARHCRVACVRDDLLVVFADESVAASRLSMILPGVLPQWSDKPAPVARVKVKIMPRREEPETRFLRPLPMSDASRLALRRAADKIEHQKEAAEALRRLADAGNANGNDHETAEHKPASGAGTDSETPHPA